MASRRDLECIEKPKRESEIMISDMIRSATVSWPGCQGELWLDSMGGVRADQSKQHRSSDEIMRRRMSWWSREMVVDSSRLVRVLYTENRGVIEGWV